MPTAIAWCSLVSDFAFKTQSEHLWPRLDSRRTADAVIRATRREAVAIV